MAEGFSHAWYDSINIFWWTGEWLISSSESSTFINTWQVSLAMLTCYRWQWVNLFMRMWQPCIYPGPSREAWQRSCLWSNKHVPFLQLEVKMGVLHHSALHLWHQLWFDRRMHFIAQQVDSVHRSSYRVAQVLDHFISLSAGILFALFFYSCDCLRISSLASSLLFHLLVVSHSITGVVICISLTTSRAGLSEDLIN